MAPSTTSSSKGTSSFTPDTQPGPRSASASKLASAPITTTTAAVIAPMSVDELLARARSMAGQRIIYKLGGGGMFASSPTPANMHHQCDCSGFVCWALGMSRQTTHPLFVKFNGGWINTDAMVHDARSQTGFFSQIAVPRPGCLVVYPSKKPNRKVGHVGIVTEVQQQNGTTVVTRVIHCSSGNFRDTGDAIMETAPTVFAKPDAIYAWYEGLP